MAENPKLTSAEILNFIGPFLLAVALEHSLLRDQNDLPCKSNANHFVSGAVLHICNMIIICEPPLKRE